MSGYHYQKKGNTKVPSKLCMCCNKTYTLNKDGICHFCRPKFKDKNIQSQGEE
jgi:hypothetical protein